MAFIKCGGCQTVIESTLRACPNCGRCPGCGKPRVDETQLQGMATCATCGAPYCDGCGRCHVCARMRQFDLDNCECGHPTDPVRLAKTEQAFRLSRRWFDIS